MKVETIAPEMKVIAIPTKIYDSADTDRIFPNCIMIPTTTREKRNAFATIAKLGIIEIPRTMANAAPNAAPDATPKVRGDTRGFPRHPCMSAPAVASAAPPIIAINTLGNLNSHMMADCKSLPLSNPNIILIVVIESNVEDDPRPIAITADNRVAAHTVAIMVTCVLESSIYFLDIESISLNFLLNNKQICPSSQPHDNSGRNLGCRNLNQRPQTNLDEEFSPS